MKGQTRSAEASRGSRGLEDRALLVCGVLAHQRDAARAHPVQVRGRPHQVVQQTAFRTGNVLVLVSDSPGLIEAHLGKALPKVTEVNPRPHGRAGSPATTVQRTTYSPRPGPRRLTSRVETV
ncbi:hypothetical protein GCM10010278_65690 [Streptomyces melanogenes]|nr:hypothetical protein GCM10010278_65690 [Streptomyces melanogenes]